MRNFTGSPDSIRHRSTSGNLALDVMLSKPGTDKSTIYRPGTGVGRTDLDSWKTRVGTEEKIGTLIACSKRQRYGMLCEADLDSGDGAGRRPGAGSWEALSKDLRACWPFGR